MVEARVVGRSAALAIGVGAGVILAAPSADQDPNFTAANLAIADEVIAEGGSFEVGAGGHQVFSPDQTGGGGIATPGPGTPDHSGHQVILPVVLNGGRWPTIVLPPDDTPSPPPATTERPTPKPTNTPGSTETPPPTATETPNPTVTPEPSPTATEQSPYVEKTRLSPGAILTGAMGPNPVWTTAEEFMGGSLETEADVLVSHRTTGETFHTVRNPITGEVGRAFGSQTHIDDDKQKAPGPEDLLPGENVNVVTERATAVISVPRGASEDDQINWGLQVLSEHDAHPSQGFGCEFGGTMSPEGIGMFGIAGGRDWVEYRVENGAETLFLKELKPQYRTAVLEAGGMQQYLSTRHDRENNTVQTGADNLAPDVTDSRTGPEKNSVTGMVYDDLYQVVARINLGQLPTEGSFHYRLNIERLPEGDKITIYRVEPNGQVAAVITATGEQAIIQMTRRLEGKGVGTKQGYGFQLGDGANAGGRIELRQVRYYADPTPDLITPAILDPARKQDGGIMVQTGMPAMINSDVAQMDPVFVKEHGGGQVVTLTNEGNLKPHRLYPLTPEKRETVISFIRRRVELARSLGANPDIPLFLSEFHTQESGRPFPKAFYKPYVSIILEAAASVPDVPVALDVSDSGDRLSVAENAWEQFPNPDGTIPDNSTDAAKNAYRRISRQAPVIVNWHLPIMTPATATANIGILISDQPKPAGLILQVPNLDYDQANELIAGVDDMQLPARPTMIGFGFEPQDSTMSVFEWAGFCANYGNRQCAAFPLPYRSERDRINNPGCNKTILTSQAHNITYDWELHEEYIAALQ